MIEFLVESIAKIIISLTWILWPIKVNTWYLGLSDVFYNGPSRLQADRCTPGNQRYVINNVVFCYKLGQAYELRGYSKIYPETSWLKSLNGYINCSLDKSNIYWFIYFQIKKDDSLNGPVRIHCYVWYYFACLVRTSIDMSYLFFTDYACIT